MPPSPPRNTPAFAAFRELLSAPESEWPLFRAALQASALEHPDLRPGWELETLGRFNRLVEGAGLYVELIAEQRRRIQRLSKYMFDLQGFAGNRGHYYDPLNSSLKDVMERHVGLPISLAIVTLAVAERLGVPLFGVGAPGHFLLGADSEDGRIYLDPFNSGAILSAEDVEELTKAENARGESFLRPATTREILSRVLNNFKNAYAQKANLVRLAATLDWLLFLAPDNIVDVRNRGLVLMRLGEIDRAAQDIRCYLDAVPAAGDAALLESELRLAAAQRARMN